MKMKFYSKSLIAGVFALSLFSCQTEEDVTEIEMNSSKSFELEGSSKAAQEDLKLSIDQEGIWEEQAFNYEISAVEPTPCSYTNLDIVLSNYIGLVNQDVGRLYRGNPDELTILNQYNIYNRIAAISDINTDYFGAEGEYTAYMVNETRNLEKFFGNAGTVDVRGQHSKTLENLELIEIAYAGAPQALIDYIKEIVSYYNTNSSQIPENPFFSQAGFASSNGYIVIGDGLVQMVAEAAGTDQKIVWSSILAHEWAHQLQFANYGDWNYPIEAFPPIPEEPEDEDEEVEDIAENTRMTELEADFITGFYLTHKRGGTFNWKRIEGVLSSFYNIGDCGFDANGHHGTPQQRLEAAYAGYELADSIQKKGMIPSDDEVHAAFIEFYNANYPSTTTAVK